MDPQTYTKALKRAHDENIRIVGESALNGNRAWVVVNPSHDGNYVVRLVAGAKELTCNCPARVPCKHRALVRESLEREAAAHALGIRPGDVRDPWMSGGQRVTISSLQAARKVALQSSLWS